MVSQRVEKLFSKLTLDEKISLLAGQNMWETVAIPRLNIPSLKTSDGPNGARGGEFKGKQTAACFPASVTLAAGWDESAALEIGKALGQEAKTKGAYVLLGPTICPHRSPLGGRNFESFSEDPLLAGNLATRYIQGLQSTGVGATVKHYAANEQETHRVSINANISERALREIYLKPFEIAIKNAVPWAVMTSYNLVNGTHSDYNEFLLQTVLRDQWKFKGLVMSDWGGTNSVAESIAAGMDLEMPGPAEKRKVDVVKKAIESGKLTTEAVDKSARAVLTLVEQAGKFENPETPPEQSIDLPEHRALIRKVGANGIVLLKNENSILPLAKDKLKSVAALGLAKECLAHGGGSAAVNTHYKVTPWDALKALLGKDFDLRYSQGAHVFRNLPEIESGATDADGKPGFTVSAFDSADLSGKPVEVKNIPSSVYIPLGDRYSALTIEGTFTPSTTGSHHISFGSLGPCKLLIDDKVVLESQKSAPDSMAFLLGGAEELTGRYSFDAGKSHKIRIETLAPVNNDIGNVLLDGLIGARLGFMTQEDYEKDILTAAVETAKNVDVALIFVGNTTAWETEGQDMKTMNLPARGSQDRLIEAVSKVNKNVVVINSTGVAIAMPWLSQVSAVVQAWFGGQESGNSIVDILFGLENPSGKLPVTFPKRIEDTPSYGNFPGDLEKLQVYYKEGIYIGYRHFDKHPETVQFPFGFGLSYTTFKISDVVLGAKTLAEKGSVTVTAKVTNTGRITGSEVVQVYVSAPGKTIDVPLKQLAGFQKVELKAGETKAAEITIGYESVAHWDEKWSAWVVEQGEYTVIVGNSARDGSGEGRFVVDSTFSFAP